MIQVTVTKQYEIIFREDFDNYEEAEILIENFKSYGYDVKYTESTLEIPLDKTDVMYYNAGINEKEYDEMTVKELRALLSACNDEAEVRLQYQDGGGLYYGNGEITGLDTEDETVVIW